MMTAGVIPLRPLRLGQRFDSVADIPTAADIYGNDTLDGAVYLSDAGYPYLGFQVQPGMAFPMVLLYLPPEYRGAVEDNYAESRGAVEPPVSAVEGTESDGGVSVPADITELVVDTAANLIWQWAGEEVARGRFSFPASRAREMGDALRDALARERSMAAHPAGKGRAA